jgi:hypothetical protein
MILVALGALSSLPGRAAQLGPPPRLADYTFSEPVSATGDLATGHNFQMGHVNDKGQFSFVIDTSQTGQLERVFAWDGTKAVKISDDGIMLPDGSDFISGNVWTSLGLNDAGTVAWVADTDAYVAGVKYVVTYSLGNTQYKIIATPGLPAPGGGSFGDGESFGPTNRMLADINNKGQVVWNQTFDGGDADGHSGVFMYDPATLKTTAVARPGAVIGGSHLTNAWWPSVNDAGQVAFIGDVDGSDAYGIYMADGQGNITPIAAAGTKVEGLTISSARWPNMANNGDIVMVGDTADSHGGAGEVTDNTAVLLYSAADKTLRVIVKPGDAVPGGVWRGVEPSRRVVQVNSMGQVAMIGVRQDGGDGIYVYQDGKVQALMLGNTMVAGLGHVDGVSKGIGGVTGWHFAMSENGYLAFPASVDRTEGFVLATPPGVGGPHP